ncbi:pneumococcal serine-rich repeat protein-like [Frankliniella occidentalis]|uniref:Pneumococcal serine-rich repeat protein-like n=1 Tax=Frankliniella occidentalis TaxID=133901 RepID=A0A9C6XS97_FRAOC|nr:pneumococcal serine-rich repeat protein-like [Frankliniella occidentalis]
MASEDSSKATSKATKENNEKSSVDLPKTEVSKQVPKDVKASTSASNAKEQEKSSAADPKTDVSKQVPKDVKASTSTSKSKEKKKSSAADPKTDVSKQVSKDVKASTATSNSKERKKSSAADPKTDVSKQVPKNVKASTSTSKSKEKKNSSAADPKTDVSKHVPKDVKASTSTSNVKEKKKSSAADPNTDNSKQVSLQKTRMDSEDSIFRSRSTTEPTKVLTTDLPRKETNDFVNDILMDRSKRKEQQGIKENTAVQMESFDLPLLPVSSNLKPGSINKFVQDMDSSNRKRKTPDNFDLDEDLSRRLPKSRCFDTDVKETSLSKNAEDAACAPFKPPPTLPCSINLNSTFSPSKPATESVIPPASYSGAAANGASGSSPVTVPAIESVIPPTDPPLDGEASGPVVNNGASGSSPVTVSTDKFWSEINQKNIVRLNRLFATEDFCEALGQEEVTQNWLFNSNTTGYEVQTLQNDMNELKDKVNQLIEDVHNMKEDIIKTILDAPNGISFRSSNRPSNSDESSQDKCKNASSSTVQMISFGNKQISSKELSKILRLEDTARHKIRSLLEKLYTESELAVMWLEQDKSKSRKIIESGVVAEITRQMNSKSNNRLIRTGEPARGYSFTVTDIRTYLSKVLHQTRSKCIGSKDNKVTNEESLGGGPDKDIKGHEDKDIDRIEDRDLEGDEDKEGNEDKIKGDDDKVKEMDEDKDKEDNEVSLEEYANEVRYEDNESEASHGENEIGLEEGENENSFDSSSIDE